MLFHPASAVIKPNGWNSFLYFSGYEGSQALLFRQTAGTDQKTKRCKQLFAKTILRCNYCLYLYAVWCNLCYFLVLTGVKISENRLGYNAENRIFTVPFYSVFLLFRDMRQGKIITF